jgi:hypothetical protein
MLVTQELQPIILKFPDFKTKIIQLYNNDSNFKSLCDDYWLSSTLLQKYRRNVESYSILEDEYSGICAILVKELNDYIIKQ